MKLPTKTRVQPRSPTGTTGGVGWVGEERLVGLRWMTDKRGGGTKELVDGSGAIINECGDELV